MNGQSLRRLNSLCRISVLACLFATANIVHAQMPQQFTAGITNGTNSVTVDFQYHPIRGTNFAVLVEDSAGNFTTNDAPPPSTYIGTVRDYPGATACALILTNGTVWEYVIFEAGNQWWADNGSVRGTYGSTTFTPTWPTAPVVTPGQAASITNVVAGDVIADIPYNNFMYTHQQSVEHTVYASEFCLMETDLVYLRDLGFLHRLSRVCIRGSQTSDPYQTGNALSTLRGQFYPFVGHEAVKFVSIPGYGGGVSLLGTIGDWYSGASVADTDGRGDAYIVWRHEVGHNHGAGDQIGWYCENYTLMNANQVGRMSGPEEAAMIASRHGGPAYGADVMENLGPYPFTVPPRASLDAVTAEPAMPVAIDALANDHDVTGEAISLLSFDANSTHGAVLTRSEGTGSGGHDRIVFTGANDFPVGLDNFQYRIQDSSNCQALGNVYVKVAPALGDLSAYLPLDESSGTVATNYAGTANATVYNGAAWVTGAVNGALSFSGSNQYVKSYVDVSETNYAVSLWFRTSQSGGGIYSVTEDGGGHDRHIYLNGGNIYARIWNEETIGSTGQNYADGQWHQVVHTFGGTVGGQKLYIDGTLVASGNKSQSDFNWQTAIHIGYSASSPTHFFNGQIDDVRIWRRALSGDEALALTQRSGTANYPQPALSTIIGGQNLTLKWLAPDGATSHDIYLGGYLGVRDGTTSSNEFKGNVTTQTFVPTTTEPGFYYWRVDERRGSTVFKGPIWYLRYLGGAGTNAVSLAEAASWWVGSGETFTQSGGISGSGTLVKVGPGTLTLTGTNSCTAAVSNGTLAVDGTLVSSSAVTVGTDGAIGGIGTVNGDITIEAGGLLSPGNGGIGRLTIGGNVVLVGGTVMEISKTGTNLDSDLVAISGTLTNGGILVVTNIGSGTLSAGDSFKLFDAASRVGNFASLTLPALSVGLMWDTTSLAVNGTISVCNITFTLTYTAGTNGVIGGTSPQTVIYGTSGAAVTVVPDTGYHFVAWSDGSTDNPRTDLNVTNDLAVTASLAINTYTLDYTAGTNGVISGTTPQTVNHGAGGTAVAAVPNVGYHFTSWSDGVVANPRTDLNITNNLSLAANFAINTYTLTYEAGTNGTVTGASPQTVNHGADGSAVTAVPETGYHFTAWSDAVTANPRTDLNVTTNINVVASFAINTYTLTYMADTNGTINGLSPQTVTHGTDGTAVTALPTCGYGFTNWSDGSMADPRTDLTVTNDVTVTANFISTTNGPLVWSGGGTNGDWSGARNWNWALPANGQALTFQGSLQQKSTNNLLTSVGQVVFNNGGFTLSGNPIVLKGGLMNAAGDNTWGIDTTLGDAQSLVSSNGTLTVSGTVSNSGNALTLDGAGSNVMVGVISGPGGLVQAGSGMAALSGINTYSGATTVSNGTLMVNGTLAMESVVTVEAAGTLTGVGTINGAVSVGGTLAPGTNGIGTLTVSNSVVLAGVTLMEISKVGTNLSGNSVFISGVLTNGGSLVVTNIGTNELTVGDSVMLFNAASHAGSFTTVSLPELAIGLKWDTNSLAVNGTIAVSNITYSLTYTAGTNGTISGTSPQTVNYGTSGTAVTAVPDTGNHFVNWSDAGTANPRSDLNVTNNIAVTANFAINTYTLTYAAGTNGSVNGTTPQTVNHGASGMAMTAVPDTGYHFVAWSDGLEANPRTDSNVTTNINVTAGFAINTYTLTYLAGTNGTISGTTPQTVNHGASGTAATAVANTGYHFVSWSDSSTANPRTDSNVTNNLSVTASFAINTYTLTYMAGANGSVSGTSPQTVIHGNDGTMVTAVGNAGYAFTNWTDGSVSNPRTDVSVTGNVTATANFISTTNSALVWNGGGTNGNWNMAGNWNWSTPANGQALTFQGSLRLNNTNNLLTGAGQVTFNNGGFTLSGNPVTLLGGIVNATGTNVWGINSTLGNAQSFVSSNGTLTVNAAVTNAGFALTLDGAGSHVLAGTVSGTGGLVKSGSGMATMGAANVYTGPTTVNNGTLKLQSPSTVSPSDIPGLVVWLDANDLSNGGGNPVNGAAVSNWVNKAAGGVGDFTVKSGAGGVYVSGGNLMNGLPVVHFNGSILQNTNSFGNSVTVMYVGRLNGAGNQRLVSSVGNNWLLGYHGGYQNKAYFNGWVSNPSTAVNYGGNLYEAVIPGSGQNSLFYQNGVLSAANQSGVAAPSGLALGGWGSGSGSETSYGDVGELLVFTNVLTTTQRVQVEQYLQAKWQGVLPVGTTINLSASGATLDLGGVNQVIGSLGGVTGSAVNLNGGALTIGLDSSSTTYSGVISGNGGVTKTGAGILTLAGSSANTYTGATVIQGTGRLALSKTAGQVAIPGDILIMNNGSAYLYMLTDNQLGGNGVLAIDGEAGNARVELGNTAQSVAGIVETNSARNGVIQHQEGSAASTNGTGTLTITGSGSYFFNGYLRNQNGILALSKTGSGTQTLYGDHITYTGTSTVNAGTLALFNTTAFASPVTVNNGGTLVMTNSGAMNVTAPMSGTGNWVMQGPGTSANGSYAVSGCNTNFTGMLVLTNMGGNGIRFQAANVNSLPGNGGMIEINPGSQLYVTAGPYNSSPTIRLSGTGWTESAGSLGAIRLATTLGSPLVLEGNTRISGWGEVGTLSGSISGAGNLEFWSSYSTWSYGYLAGSQGNTYTGDTTVATYYIVRPMKGNGAVAIPGNLQFGNASQSTYFRCVAGYDNQFGSGSTVNFNAAEGQWARFELDGTTQTVANIVSVGGATGGIIQNSEWAYESNAVYTTGCLVLTGVSDTTWATYFRDGSVGKLALTLNSPGGKLTLSGARISHTGQTTVQSGALTLTATTAFNSPIALTGGNLVCNTAGNYVMCPKPITGAGSVTATNTTYWTYLTADNTYTGGTYVTPGGMLLLGNNTTAGGVVGPITVNGTLGLYHGNAWVFTNVVTGTGSLNLYQPGGNTVTVSSPSINLANIAGYAGTLSNTTVTLTGNLGYGNGNGQTGLVIEAGANITVLGVPGLQVTGNSYNNQQLNIRGGMLTATNGYFEDAWDTAYAVTQTGGLVNVGGMRSTGYWGGWSRNNTYTLNGGTLVLGSLGIAQNYYGLTVNLGGGVLSASANTYITASTQFTGASGNTVVDPAGFNVSLNSGASGTGGFVLNGAGTLTMGGTYTYSGPTTVSAGFLQMNGTYAGGGDYTVSGGRLSLAGSAVIGATSMTVTNIGVVLGSGRITAPVTVAQGGLLTGTLTVSNQVTVGLGGTINPGAGGVGVVTASSLTLLAGSAIRIESASSGLIQVLGNFTTSSNGTAVINVGSVPDVGQYTLIRYSGTIQGGGLAGLSLGSLPRGLVATLVDNTATHSVDLVVSGGVSLVWRGTANANWDAGISTNWLNETTPDTFFDLANATFDDEGASVGTVVITTNVRPCAVLVNASANYTFGGTGAITGRCGLVKSGIGRLTVLNANTYTGATVISVGTIQVGTNGATGSLGSGSIIDQASLVFNRNNTCVVGNLISGTGTVTQAGSGWLVLTGNNVYTGGTVINAGGMQLGNNTASGGVIGSITDNANLQIYRSDAYSLTNTVSGTGSLTICSPGGNAVTLAGSVSLGGNLCVAANGTLVFGADATASFATATGMGGGYAPANISITGGTLLISGLLRDGWDGRYLIQQSGGAVAIGTMSSTGGGGSSRNNSYTLTGGRLTVGSIYAGDGNWNDCGIILNLGGGTLAAGGNFTISSSGPAIVLNLTGTGGDVTIDSGTFTMGSNYPLTGVGGLTKVGPGTLALNGADTYAGTTTVLCGTLQRNGTHVGGGAYVVTGGTVSLGSAGRLASASLTVGTNGVATGSGTFALPVTIGNGGRLVGNGLVTGDVVIEGGGLLSGTPTAAAAVTVRSSGVIDPGAGGVGTITASNVTLEAGAVIRFQCASNGVLQITDSLSTTQGGTNTIDVVSTPGLGQYTLIRYGSGGITGGGFGSLQLGSVPRGWIATLVDNTANHSVDILVTGTASVAWRGTVNGDWDMGVTTNWLNGTDPDVFRNGDAAAFDDESGRAGTVNLTTRVLPASVTVNSSSNFTFGGTGGITGAASLTKDGTGTLVLSGVHTYAGNTRIDGGALELAGGSQLGGGVYNAAITNSGTLKVNSVSNQTFSGVMSGAGALVKANSGILYLNAANSFTGPFDVQGGTVQLNARGGSYGASRQYTLSTNTDVTVANATLLVPYGSYGVDWLDVHSLTLAGGATLRAASQYQPDNGDIGIRLMISVIGTNTFAATGGSYTKNNYLQGGMLGDAAAVMKFQSGASGHDIFLNGGVWSNFLGTVSVANDLALSADIDLLNASVTNGTGSIKLSSANRVVQFGQLWGGGILSANGQTGGEWRIGKTGTSCTFGGVVAGDCTLTKVGSGTLTLTGASTYSGATVVIHGTLLADNVSGSGTGSDTVQVCPGAFLGGCGSIGGSVSVEHDATVVPGTPSVNDGLGTLTVGSGTLATGAILSVKVKGESCSKLQSIGTASVNGARLSVNVIDGAVVADADYVILSAGSISGTFAGLPEGANVTAGGMLFRITYTATEIKLRALRSGPLFELK